ncbi:MAG: glycosyltransferase [Clostridia bacterium]|nr:glycosyltransferase [Clostridia bacterium]
MKVLILSASTGGGHMSAAKALMNYIESHDDNSTAQIVDCIEYVSHALNIIVSEGYRQLALKAPAIFGFLYHSTNKSNTLYNLSERILVLFAKRLLPLIDEYKPDIVISTHAFAGDLMAELKKKKNINIPIISIVTDFSPHKMYIHPYINKYVVSSEKMVDEMIEMNVDKDRVTILGIPINTSFYNKIDREMELRLMELDPSIPTLLIMAGSFGVTDILKMYAELSTSETEFQIIVITGKNPKLFNAFNIFLGREMPDDVSEFQKTISELKLKYRLGTKYIENPKDTVLLYYTNEVEKYMHVSDLIITKPGGLTVSESLACGLPMAIFNAFPGQEEDNSDFLISNDVAVKITKDNCKRVIENLLNDSVRLSQMKENCRRISKYKSAEGVYNLILEIMQETNMKNFR